MRQTFTIPQVTLDWSDWRPWRDLVRSCAGLPRSNGVYEVRRRNAHDASERLHIGKAANKQMLQTRVRDMVKGRKNHAAGKRIVVLESEEALDDLMVRWATTDRPAAAEEELHLLYKQQHGTRLPHYDHHT